MAATPPPVGPETAAAAAERAAEEAVRTAAAVMAELDDDEEDAEFSDDDSEGEGGATPPVKPTPQRPKPPPVMTRESGANSVLMSPPASAASADPVAPMGAFTSPASRSGSPGGDPRAFLFSPPGVAAGAGARAAAPYFNEYSIDPKSLFDFLTANIYLTVAAPGELLAEQLNLIRRVLDPKKAEECYFKERLDTDGIDVIFDETFMAELRNFVIRKIAAGNPHRFRFYRFNYQTMNETYDIPLGCQRHSEGERNLVLAKLSTDQDAFIRDFRRGATFINGKDHRAYMAQMDFEAFLERELKPKYPTEAAYRAAVAVLKKYYEQPLQNFHQVILGGNYEFTREKTAYIEVDEAHKIGFRFVNKLTEMTPVPQGMITPDRPSYALYLEVETIFTETVVNGERVLHLAEAKLRGQDAAYFNELISISMPQANETLEARLRRHQGLQQRAILLLEKRQLLAGLGGPYLDLKQIDQALKAVEAAGIIDPIKEREYLRLCLKVLQDATGIIISSDLTTAIKALMQEELPEALRLEYIHLCLRQSAGSILANPVYLGRASQATLELPDAAARAAYFPLCYQVCAAHPALPIRYLAMAVQALQREGVDPAGQTADLLRQKAEALQRAEDPSILHRSLLEACHHAGITTATLQGQYLQSFLKVQAELHINIPVTLFQNVIEAVNGVGIEPHQKFACLELCLKVCPFYAADVSLSVLKNALQGMVVLNTDELKLALAAATIVAEAPESLRVLYIKTFLELVHSEAQKKDVLPVYLGVALQALSPIMPTDSNVDLKANLKQALKVVAAFAAEFPAEQQLAYTKLVLAKNTTLAAAAKIPPFYLAKAIRAIKAAEITASDQIGAYVSLFIEASAHLTQGEIPLRRLVNALKILQRLAPDRDALLTRYAPHFEKFEGLVKMVFSETDDPVEQFAYIKCFIDLCEPDAINLPVDVLEKSIDAFKRLKFSSMPEKMLYLTLFLQASQHDQIEMLQVSDIYMAALSILSARGSDAPLTTITPAVTADFMRRLQVTQKIQAYTEEENCLDYTRLFLAEYPTLALPVLDTVLPLLKSAGLALTPENQKYFRFALSALQEQPSPEKEQLKQALYLMKNFDLAEARYAECLRLCQPGQAEALQAFLFTVALGPQARGLMAGIASLTSEAERLAYAKVFIDHPVAVETFSAILAVVKAEVSVQQQKAALEVCLPLLQMIPTPSAADFKTAIEIAKIVYPADPVTEAHIRLILQVIAVLAREARENQKIYIPAFLKFCALHHRNIDETSLSQLTRAIGVIKTPGFKTTAEDTLLMLALTWVRPELTTDKLTCILQAVDAACLDDKEVHAAIEVCIHFSREVETFSKEQLTIALQATKAFKPLEPVNLIRLKQAFGVVSVLRAESPESQLFYAKVFLATAVDHPTIAPANIATIITALREKEIPDEEQVFYLSWALKAYQATPASAEHLKTVLTAVRALGLSLEEQETWLSLTLKACQEIRGVSSPQLVTAMKLIQILDIPATQQLECLKLYVAVCNVPAADLNYDAEKNLLRLLLQTHKTALTTKLTDIVYALTECFSKGQATRLGEALEKLYKTGSQKVSGDSIERTLYQTFPRATETYTFLGLGVPGLTAERKNRIFIDAHKVLLDGTKRAAHAATASVLHPHAAVVAVTPTAVLSA